MRETVLNTCNYYMEKSVLLGTKPLVDSIRHFIRDPSSVFSVCHFCECPYRLITSRFPPFAFVELVSRVAFLVYNKSMASRFTSISDEEVKEFTKKL